MHRYDGWMDEEYRKVCTYRYDNYLTFLIALSSACRRAEVDNFLVVLEYTYYKISKSTLRTKNLPKPQTTNIQTLS